MDCQDHLTDERFRLRFTIKQARIGAVFKRYRNCDGPLTYHKTTFLFHGGTGMHAPAKYFEKVLSIAANGAWFDSSRLNRTRPNPSWTPKWSDGPLLKSYQKTRPPLGWPRQTDSLCPACVGEARASILDGRNDVSILVNEQVGEI